MEGLDLEYHFKLWAMSNTMPCPRPGIQYDILLGSLIYFFGGECGKGQYSRELWNHMDEDTEEYYTHKM